MSHRRLHIVLIGFMGSGKTTIGTLLAKSLNLPFIDLDQKIVEHEKMSIINIFTSKGEDYFRRIESSILKDALASNGPSIIATGGGAPCFLDGMKYIRKSSYSIYLKVGKERLLNRIYSDKTRPLAADKTKSQLKQFIDISLRSREKYYKKANKTILAYNSPESIGSRILNQLDREKL